MFSYFRPAATLLAVFTFLTGVLYPAVVTGISQVTFPVQANGSLMVQNGQIVGSRLIGQGFEDPSYFWGRPSATGPVPYNAAASSGSNLGPSNPALVQAVRERVSALRASDPTSVALPVPVDLVTTSGSGLDPHISPSAALYQVRRVARLRGVSQDAVQLLVDAHIEPRTLGIFGEPRVNVLLLNLALDQLVQNKAQR